MTSGFTQKYGPWALIACASMGIGAALSHEAARRGLNVLMLARGAAQLDAAAQSVRGTHGVRSGRLPPTSRTRISRRG